MKTHLSRTMLSVCLILLLAGSAFSQIKTGTIRGTIRDESGEILPGAAVEIRSDALMGTKTALTNDKGAFRFAALPPGEYELMVTLEGFQPLNQKGLKVVIDGTVSLDLALKAKTLEESITVVGQAPLVDTVKSSFSSTYEGKFIESLPTRRYTFFDMVQASPGLTPPTTESSRVSAFGSEVKSNAYYLNGTDISAPSTGAAWIWPIPDSIEELEVTGIGAKAEYGNYMGAVINVISKTGSNTLSGSAKYFLQSQSLTGNNTPDVKWPYHVSHWHDLVFSLGGPILKDKLWFFSAIQHQMNKTTGIGADPAYPAKYEIKPMIISRLDYQLNKNNKLTFYLHYNRYHWSSPPTEYMPYETVSGENDWVVSPNAEWLSILNENTYFELKFASFFTYLWYDPLTGNMTDPGHYDWGTGQYSVNATYFYHWHTGRVQLNAAVSHFADDFIQGNHDFKFGVQYNHGYSDVIEGYWGGVAYMDWMGAPYAAYFWPAHHIGGIVDAVGAFVDDSWAISKKMTLNLGLRFDYSHGRIPEYDELDIYEEPTGNVIPGISRVGNWKTLAPRVGINYLLTSDAKTVLRFTLGRYYDALIIGDFQRACPAQANFTAKGYNPATASYDVLWYSIDYTKQVGLDSSLKPAYSDSVSLALEREIFRDFSLSATFIYKRSLDNIAQTNTAASYTEIPFNDVYGGNTISVYNQVSPLQNFYLITNPGNKFTYRALIIVANKRFSRNWQAYSSFTLSRAWFKPEGYRDKNELINAEGPVFQLYGARDRTWMFKVGGTYSAPLGIMFGANVIYQQGSSWERTVFVPGLNQGGKFIKAEEAGSRRFPNELYFDVKIAKDFRIYNRLSAKVTFDVFNLFNKDTNMAWVATHAESPNFEVPTEIILPRRAMLGLQLIF